MLPLILKAVGMKMLSRKSNNTTTTDTRPKRKIGCAPSLTILAVLVMMVAFILSILCVFAGSKPGMMEDYTVFTLNTSRIGENILQELDGKIMSVHLKRSEPIVVLSVITPAPTLPVPTTLITMAPRDIKSSLDSLAGEASSKAHSAGSAVESGAHSAASAAESGAHSIESVVSSKATSALGAAQTKVVQLVNKAYHGVIDGLDLKDFYSIHISSSCVGTYQFKNGTNITVGDSGLPNKGTHKHVDSCAKHSAIDPLQLIRIVYWIGIVFTGLALVLGFIGIFIKSRKIAAFNIIATVLAFIFIGLASAVTHGLALGAAKFINFVGKSVGIEGDFGHKFMTLTWAVTVLLLINMGLWTLLFVMRKKSGEASGPVLGGLGRSMRSKPGRPDRTSAIIMDDLSQPAASHPRDRYGNPMI